MRCICTQACYGAGGVNRRFEKDEAWEFEKCPDYFRPAHQVVVGEDTEPETLKELGEEEATADAEGQPTEKELDGSPMFDSE